MPTPKWCFVPKCTNVSIKAPLKVFVTVPKAPKTRAKWFAAVRRDIKEVSPHSTMFCCEDHFDLEDDMENYMEYKLSKVKARMKPAIVPHKFACQPGRNLLTTPRLFSKKRAKKKEMLGYLQQSGKSEPSTSFTTVKTKAKACQTKLVHFRSKYVQACPKLKRDAAVSPIRFLMPEQSLKPPRKRLKNEQTDFSNATKETSQSDFYPSNQSSQST